MNHTIEIDTLNHAVKQNVQDALKEDVGTGDVTSHLIPEETVLSAHVVTRESCVLSGRPWFDAAFLSLDNKIDIHWFYQEGEKVESGATLVKIEGNARHLLTAERTALNFLQLLSAVATTTRQYVDQMANKAAILDTRKTLPGLRIAQKYAVSCGGGKNHRLGLYDAFLIKENHIKAQGSISEAIRLAKEMRPDLKVEVEVETLAELNEAIEAKPDVIMLDNFDIPMIKKAVALNRDNTIQLEASGNVNLSNVKAYAEAGVDCISIGGLTKHVKAIDLSLLII